MKTIFLAIVSIAACNLLHAQNSTFDGEWTGVVKVDPSGQVMNVRMVIQDNKVVRYFDSRHGSNLLASEKVESQSLKNKNNFLFYWINNLKGSSETQTYALSIVNDEKLHIVWTRQLNVQGMSSKMDNDAWSVQGSGYLVRTPQSELAKQ